MPTGIGGETAWWCPSLDDSGNGTSTLNDLVAGTYPGTLTNMTPASDWVSDTGSGGVRAINFDGSNDYVISDLNPDGSQVMSVSLWCKYSSSSQFAGLFYWRNGSFPFEALNVGILLDSSGAAGAKLFCQDNNSNTGMRFSISPSNYNDNAWHHVAAVRASGTLKLYVDGSVVATTTAAMPNISHTSKSFIGSRANTNTSVGTFSGRMDDIRFYQNKVLSDAEVASLSSRRGYQPSSGEFESGMFGGMSGAMTGGMAS